MDCPFIICKKCYLRTVMEKDINQRYLSWLNDQKINIYSNRKYFPYSYEELKEYYSARKNDSILLAIIDKNNDKHIGNILLGPIKWHHSNAEISILIGEKNYWNKGFASDAIYHLTKHAFFVLNLHRVEAGSCNPAFLKLVCNKLNWKKEGCLREKYLINEQFRDVINVAILKHEFKIIDEFELNEKE